MSDTSSLEPLGLGITLLVFYILNSLITSLTFFRSLINSFYFMIIGFRLFKKIVIPFDIVSQPQQSTTFPPEEGTDFKISGTLFFVVK